MEQRLKPKMLIMSELHDEVKKECKKKREGGEIIGKNVESMRLIISPLNESLCSE